jgi:hypothetical protein
MSVYLNKINELPIKQYIGGNNTRKGSPRGHVYKVNIRGIEYFKFQIKRAGKSSTVYFKKKKEAIKFRESVKRTKSLVIAATKAKKKNALRSLYS